MIEVLKSLIRSKLFYFLNLFLLRLLDLSILQINIRLYEYLISWQFPPSCAGRVGTDRRMEQFMKYFSSSRTICSGAFPIIFLKLGPQPASFCLLVIKKQINRRLALMNNDWCTATLHILYLVWFCDFIAPINSPHSVQMIGLNNK